MKINVSVSFEGYQGGSISVSHERFYCSTQGGQKKTYLGEPFITLIHRDLNTAH